jgi:lipoprotein-releasing system ATP-binding protein
MILKVQNISKSYFLGGNPNGRMILNHLDMNIKQGERIAISGPSGSGKTTLLNLIGTLDRPDSGRIFFDNIDLSEMNDKQLSQFRNEKIGFVFQQHYLLPQLSLWENVLLPTLAGKRQQNTENEERARRLIDRVGLTAVMHQKPSALSGGECQRCAVVRALINTPMLLLADEPTGALDHSSSGILADLLVELNKEEGVTLLVVTHSSDVASKMDRIYSLVNGKLTDEHS